MTCADLANFLAPACKLNRSLSISAQYLTLDCFTEVCLYKVCRHNRDVGSRVRWRHRTDVRDSRFKRSVDESVSWTGSLEVPTAGDPLVDRFVRSSELESGFCVLATHLQQLIAAIVPKQWAGYASVHSELSVFNTTRKANNLINHEVEQNDFCCQQ